MDTFAAELDITIPASIMATLRPLATVLNALNENIHPLTKFLAAILLISYLIKQIFSLIVHAFFDTPPHRLPTVIALLLLIAAGYLHFRITVEDEMALRSSEEAAENEERHGHVARTHSREQVGGLDRDVWQGGPELRKRGRGNSREDART